MPIPEIGRSSGPPTGLGERMPQRPVNRREQESILLYRQAKVYLWKLTVRDFC